MKFSGGGRLWGIRPAIHLREFKRLRSSIANRFRVNRLWADRG
jgi:hypothetical protein